METVSFLSPFLFILLLFYVPSSYSASHNSHQTFIVHVSKSHKPSIFTTHQDWYSSILRSLSPRSANSSKLLYTYDRAAHGFSVHLTPAQAAQLRHIPGVLAVVPDGIQHLHITRTPQFLGFSDPLGLWPNTEYGEDVIIGVLDTGIWPEHPSFSEEGLSGVPSGWKGTCEIGPKFSACACSKKIIGARAFFKGYEAYLGHPLDETKESKSPRDTIGHGTHTASIAAGSVVPNASLSNYARGEARGMATKARIAAYKVCWNEGCLDSDILAALDHAIADGVHVISLSIGKTSYPQQYDLDSNAIGAFGATGHGIVVSCSSGNAGPDPYTTVNVAPWILSAGASTIDREFPADVILGNGRIIHGVSVYFGKPLGDTKFPLVYAKHCGSRYCYPGKLDPSKVKGKIVLCDSGGNSRVEKGSAVMLAGGVGMILEKLPDSTEKFVADPHLIPATMVDEKAGDEIRSYLKSDPSPAATIAFLGTVIGESPSAPRVASFSSRGPNLLTPEILKPDVIAPGVNILAGWTGSVGPTGLDIDSRKVKFNIKSGTSQSCPHVSGLAALLRKAYPKWSPAAIKSALMTTAYNLDNSGKDITDLASGIVSTPFVHGAGHVDPNRALDPGLIYDIGTSDYISFLCSIGYNSKRISVFVKDAASIDCSSASLGGIPGNLNYPSFSVVFGHDNSIVKYRRVVKNVGNKADAAYEVKVSAPASVAVSVSPAKLAFSEENDTLPYQVTFTSLLGSSEGIRSIESAFGSIEWNDGVHVVRSPIVAIWQLDLTNSI